jgi:DNA-binding CsgD family transcriptional regulator
MIRLDALKAATEDFLAASLVGDGYEDALLRIGEAADRSAVVLSLDDGVNMKASMQTADVAAGVLAFAAGKSPPNPRTLRCTPGLREGFRTDQDDFGWEEIARSPWYQEFLRPHGVFWNATASLLRGDGAAGVYLSFKRGFKAGPYTSAEIAALSEVLPDLRRAVSLARRMREFEALGMVKLIHERGDPVFELDVMGRVLRIHAFDDRQPVPSINVVQRRLVARDRMAQPDLDRAVHRATASPGATAVARLPGSNGEWNHLLIIPVTGRASELFFAAAAIAVLIRRTTRSTPLTLAPTALCDAFGLTDREAAVATLIGQGLTLDDVARTLGIAIGTTRNHLKAVFDKTHTNRQAELAELLGRLRP